MKTTWISMALVAAIMGIMPLQGRGQQFKEVHAQAGLDWTHGDYVHEMMSTAWVDLNQDGRLDLWVGPHGTGNKNKKETVAR
jgi:hypothetical protein